MIRKLIICIGIAFIPINMLIAQGRIDQPKPPVEIHPAEVRGYVLTVVATAYTPFEPGMTSGTGLAYDGRRAIPFKTLAVDPKVIPLGSRVFIPQYGWFLAHDTGNLIKGNIVDICLEHEVEMIEWGRRQVEIYVIPPNKPYRMAW